MGFRFLDGCADDINLTTRADLPHHDFIDFTAHVPRIAQGLDLFPARRTPSHDGRFDVPIHGQGQRPRNRRGRHNQHIRRKIRFGRQTAPLTDTKAVLLIRHDEGQMAELDVFLKHGVGPDEELQRSVGQALQDFPAGRSLRIAGQQSQANSRAGEEGRQRLEVLPG